MSDTQERGRFAALAAQLDAMEDPTQPSRTVDLLARMYGYSDGDLQRRTGISRPTINQKRSGRSPIRAVDLWPLADALDTEVEVLLLKPSEAAAWMVTHRATELDRGELLSKGRRPSRCTWRPSSRLTLPGTNRNNSSFAARAVGASSNGVEGVACGVAHHPPLEGLFP